jgi:hypothetical protein
MRGQPARRFWHTRTLVAAVANLNVSFLYGLLVVMGDRRNVRGEGGLHEP